MPELHIHSTQNSTYTAHRTGDRVHIVGHTCGIEQARGWDDDIRYKRGRGCSCTSTVSDILLHYSSKLGKNSSMHLLSGFKFSKMKFKGLGVMLFPCIPTSDVETCGQCFRENRLIQLENTKQKFIIYQNN